MNTKIKFFEKEWSLLRYYLRSVWYWDWNSFISHMNLHFLKVSEMSNSCTYCTTSCHQNTVTYQNKTNQIVINWVKKSDTNWVSHVYDTLSKNSTVKTIKSSRGQICDGIKVGFKNSLVSADVGLSSFEGSVIIIDFGLKTSEISCHTTHASLSRLVPVSLKVD